MLGHFVDLVPHAIFRSKDVVQEGIALGYIVEGEQVGVGFPYLHNVYRVTKDGGLNFVYHFTRKQYGRIL